MQLPNSSNLINLCKTLQQLQQLHAHATTSGLISHHNKTVTYNFLANFLHAITSISPLSSSSSRILRYVDTLFGFIPNPSTFCFNTLVRMHTLHFSPFSAIAFFNRMRRFRVSPDFHTFPFVFKACAQMRDLSLGRCLHSQALRFGFDADLFVVNSLIHVYMVTAGRMEESLKVFDESPQRDVVTYNVLIDGFVKAGEVSRARELFDSMPFRDNISWNSLIAGYARMDHCKEAVELFNEMIALDLRPDNVALVSALSACAQLGALERGEVVHDYIERNGIPKDSFLSTGLVDFYAKCGFIDKAMQIFESCLEKSLFTWNAMLVSLAMHGNGELTLDYFSKMVSSGVRPDGVSFLGVLAGCSHAGLVHEAKTLFYQMESVYGVEKELKHYGCMADLLGRAGLIKEAMEMIKEIPEGSNDVFVWSGLLGGCRIHGNTEVAERAAEHVKALKPEDGGVYKVMADVYANAERWEDVARLRRLMETDKRVKKNAGCSFIELDGFAHEFIAGDDLHPRTSDIYLVLDSIREHQFEAY